MTIQPYAIEIRITADSIQQLEELEGRVSFLKNVVEPMMQILKKETPYRWFFWLFEPDPNFKQDMTVVCLMINIFFESEEKRKKAKNILVKFIEEEGFKQPESYRIKDHDGQGDMPNFGLDGTEIFYDYMNICCEFILKRMNEGNQKFKDFTDGKFLHCFMNATGRLYRQEVRYFVESAVDRLEVMKLQDAKSIRAEIEKDLHDKLQAQGLEPKAE